MGKFLSRHLDFKKAKMIVVRIASANVRADQPAEKDTADDQDFGSAEKTIACDFNAALKKTTVEWDRECKETGRLLIKIGLLTTVAYELVLYSSPKLQCCFVMIVSGTMLAQQTSLWGRQLNQTALDPGMVRALLVGNFFALTLHLASLTDLILRFSATFHIIVASIFATLMILQMDGDNLFGQLTQNLTNLALRQSASARNLSSELLENIIDSTDEYQGCALVTLEEPLQKSVVLQDSTQNFVSLIKESETKSLIPVEPKELLTNLPCKEVGQSHDQEGQQRKLLDHLVTLQKNRRENKVSLQVKKTSRRSQSSLSLHRSAGKLQMDIKKMAQPGLFLVKTFKKMEKMPGLRKIKPLCLGSDLNGPNRIERRGRDRVQSNSARSPRSNSSAQQEESPSGTDSLVTSFFSDRSISVQLLDQEEEEEKKDTVAELGLEQSMPMHEQEQASFNDQAALESRTIQEDVAREQQQEASEESKSQDAVIQRGEDGNIISCAPQILRTQTEVYDSKRDPSRANLLQELPNFMSRNQPRRVMSTQDKQIRVPNRIQTLTDNQTLTIIETEGTTTQPLTTIQMQEDVFVFQIVHDLRHPLDAQKSKIQEIRRSLQKKYIALRNLTGPEMENLMENTAVQSQLALLEKILSGYYESKLVAGMSLGEKFTKLLQLLLEGLSARGSKYSHREMLMPLKNFSGPSKIDEFGKVVERESIEFDNFQRPMTISAGSSGQPEALLSPNQSQVRQSSQNLESKSQNLTFGAKKNMQLISREELILVQDPPLDVQSHNSSISDKEVLETPLQQAPAYSKPQEEAQLFVRDEEVKIEEEINSSESISVRDTENDQHLLDDVGSEEDECGIPTFNQSRLIHENSEGFKRKFGKEKDLKQFCEEKNIKLPSKPFIKQSSHFASSLAQERLFIESKVAESADFDFLSNKKQVVKSGGPDEQDSKEDSPLKAPTRRSDFRDQIHNSISNVKSHLIEAIDKHKKAQLALNDKTEEKLAAAKPQDIFVKPQDIFVKLKEICACGNLKESPRKLSLSSSNPQNMLQRVKSSEQSDVGLNLLNLLSEQPLFFDLLMLMLTERKLQSDTMEQTLKFLRQVRTEFTQIEAQLDMSMFLMKDLLDHAQMKAGSFSITNEYFNLEKVINRTFMTNIKFATDKKISLIGPTYATEQERVLFKNIYGDERRYLQVLINFVNNAIKFTTSGGSVTILVESLDIANKRSLRTTNLEREEFKNGTEEIPDKELGDEIIMDKEESSFIESGSGQDEEEKIEIQETFTVDVRFKMTIRDTGVGISEANRKKLFQNFAKLEETKGQNQSGVGLGLTIARDLIAAFGGTIEIEKPFEIGTDFVIYLTAKSKVTEKDLTDYLKSKVTFVTKNQDESIDFLLPPLSKPRFRDSGNSSGSSSLAPSSSKFSQGQSSFSGSNSMNGMNQHLSRIKIFTFRRCLVANDQTFLLDMLKQILKDQFDEVVTVTDGQQAVDKVTGKAANYFNMIILDINMPQKDGVSACIEITRYFDKQRPVRGLKVPSWASQAASNQRKFTEQGGLQFRSKFSYNRNEPVKISTMAVHKQPLIFALTSDVDQEKADYYLQCGFHSVYKDITVDAIQEMLAASNLPSRAINNSQFMEQDSSRISYEDQLNSSRY